MEKPRHLWHARHPHAARLAAHRPGDMHALPALASAHPWPAVRAPYSAPTTERNRSMTTTRQINLMPEPVTPEFERFLDFMRQMYCDPANVRFRRHMQADEVNMRFLTQGGRMPLPDIEDPVRNAVEVTVTL